MSLQFKIRIIPAIKEHLLKLKGPPKEMKDMQHNFRTRRTQQRQREDLAAVDKMLLCRNKIDLHSTERK